MKFSIEAPIGGIGNHVRWLVLLDNQFKFSLKKLPWPPPDPHQVEQYPDCDIVTLADKVEFIKNYVYAPFRSWHNWLIIEWHFRKKLDAVIPFEHQNYNNYYKNGYNDNLTKTLALGIHPDLACRLYFKFNPNLNSATPELFKRQISHNNWLLDRVPYHKNFLQLYSDVLYNNSLNRELYQQIINFFELDNHYDIANEIHQLWYQGHVRAEKEFVQDVNNFYSSESI
jgi:hypothetical protein